MSPASLRRYRAERLLREEFRSLRAGVIASARASLRTCGARLDDGDLEACYAQAWQGLYASTLEGRRILNPAGWLTVVTFRRAIDEHRARTRAGLRDPGDGLARDGGEELKGAGQADSLGTPPYDIAQELDERNKLRDLFEALRLRLSAREQQAATLCYLQGLSRAQAARTMGVSEARLRKLMEGRGPGRPGVAAKMAALLETVRRGEWCEEQGSLMRGLAYGMLDPCGERHRLALGHVRACPACRAYVASLRGLAALLPPAPSLLPLLVAGSAGAKAAGLGAPQGAAAGGALGAPGALGPGAAASGAAGAGAAGGGWLLVGGGVSAKFAAGCLLALGVGAGCAVLGMGREAARTPTRVHARARAERSSRGAPSAPVPPDETGRVASPASNAAATAPASASAGAPNAPSRAGREFGLEQRGQTTAGETSRALASTAAPKAAAATSAGAEFAPAPSSSPSTSTPARASVARSPSGESAARREFSPG